MEGRPDLLEEPNRLPFSLDDIPLPPGPYPSNPGRINGPVTAAREVIRPLMDIQFRRIRARFKQIAREIICIPVDESPPEIVEIFSARSERSLDIIDHIPMDISSPEDQQNARNAAPIIQPEGRVNSTGRAITHQPPPLMSLEVNRSRQPFHRNYYNIDFNSHQQQQRYFQPMFSHYPPLLPVAHFLTPPPPLPTGHGHLLIPPPPPPLCDNLFSRIDQLSHIFDQEKRGAKRAYEAERGFVCYSARSDNCSPIENLFEPFSPESADLTELSRSSSPNEEPLIPPPPVPPIIYNIKKDEEAPQIPLIKPVFCPSSVVKRRRIEPSFEPLDLTKWKIPRKVSKEPTIPSSPSVKPTEVIKSPASLSKVKKEKSIPAQPTKIEGGKKKPAKGEQKKSKKEEATKKSKEEETPKKKKNPKVKDKKPKKALVEKKFKPVKQPKSLPSTEEKRSHSKSSSDENEKNFHSFSNLLKELGKKTVLLTTNSKKEKKSNQIYTSKISFSSKQITPFEDKKPDIEEKKNKEKIGLQKVSKKMIFKPAKKTSSLFSREKILSQMKRNTPSMFVKKEQTKLPKKVVQEDKKNTSAIQQRLGLELSSSEEEKEVEPKKSTRLFEMNEEEFAEFKVVKDAKYRLSYQLESVDFQEFEEQLKLVDEEDISYAEKKEKRSEIIEFFTELAANLNHPMPHRRVQLPPSVDKKSAPKKEPSLEISSNEESDNEDEEETGEEIVERRRIIHHKMRLAYGLETTDFQHFERLMTELDEEKGSELAKRERRDAIIRQFDKLIKPKTRQPTVEEKKESPVRQESKYALNLSESSSDENEDEAEEKKIEKMPSYKPKLSAGFAELLAGPGPLITPPRRPTFRRREKSNKEVEKRQEASHNSKEAPITVLIASAKETSEITQTSAPIGREVTKREGHFCEYTGCCDSNYTGIPCHFCRGLHPGKDCAAVTLLHMRQYQAQQNGFCRLCLARRGKGNDHSCSPVWCENCLSYCDHPTALCPRAYNDAHACYLDCYYEANVITTDDVLMKKAKRQVDWESFVNRVLTNSIAKITNG